MSCWCRTTVLRIPAKSLGFKYKREWDEFLNKHEEDFNWEPGYFAEALCEDYLEWFAGCHDYRYSDDPETLLPEPDSRHPKAVPGPFLDYYIDQIAPLPFEENSYNENDVERLLTEEEMDYYLPVYKTLFPGFTLEDMKDVHFCEYEWYNGSDAPYRYSLDVW